MTQKQDKGDSVAPGYCLFHRKHQGVTNPHKISECFCSCHMPPKDMLSGFPCHTAHLGYSDLLLWWKPKRETLREEIIILDQGFQVQSICLHYFGPDGRPSIMVGGACHREGPPLTVVAKHTAFNHSLLVVIPYSDLSVLHPFLCGGCGVAKITWGSCKMET